MSQTDKHLEWCLKDQRRLMKTKPDKELAEKHLEKSKYNYQVLLALERLKYHDWALNVGFYAIYHCFLSILAKQGYESRNQSCTITAVMTLIEGNRISLNRDLLSQFDTLNPEPNLENPTIRQSRELSTYGIETSIDLKELDKIKRLAIKMQQETIRILKE